MLSSTAIAWPLLAAAALVACAPSARKEPSLEEKCEALARYCVDLPQSRKDLANCHDIGAQGAREPAHADQCFVAYDECYDDCYYLYLQRGDGG